MKLEVTNVILESQFWLLGGFFVYFLLTLLKVYIIWDIQPDIFNNPTGEPLFKNFFSGFFRSVFADKRLMKATFMYLFNYKERDFLIIKDEKAKGIKKRLNILDGFTAFLKPYLIFAFIWAIFKIWISMKFFYDESTIVLGEMQQLLTYVASIDFFAFLREKKDMIIFFYGLVCIMIPFLYERETSTKKYKNYFSRMLVYLSLLANISFFGFQAGKTIIDKSDALESLQAEVTGIHDSIYKKLIVAIQLNDLQDVVQEENELYKGAVDHFDSLAGSVKNLGLNKPVQEELQEKMDAYFSEIKTTSVVEEAAYREAGTASHFNSATFAAFVNENEREGAASTDYAAYMGNQQAWNKETGEKFLADIKELTDEGKGAVSEFGKKLERFLGCLFDFGLERLATDVFSWLDMKPHKTLKKVITIVFSENYKKRVQAKAVKIFSLLKASIFKAREIFTKKNNVYQAAPEEVELFSAINNEFYDTESRIALAKQEILQKIRSFRIEIPEKEYIMAELALYAKEKDRQVIRSDAEAIEYLKNKGFDCADNVDFIEGIKNREREEYLKRFINYNDENNRKKYLSFLQGNNALLEQRFSNLDLIDLRDIRGVIGDCGTRSSSVICFRCGLPCAFPVCLSRGR